jgi:hypothetical protein
MAPLLCTHCTRRIFLSPRQLPPRSGLCVPCGHKHAERQNADQAWRRFLGRVLEPAEAVHSKPLLPAADLRHLL